MHPLPIDDIDDWTNPRTGALYRRTIDRIESTARRTVTVPTSRNWRLRIDLRDSRDRTRRLLLQRHLGRCTVSLAVQPHCIDCDHDFDRVVIDDHLLLLLAGKRSVAAIRLDPAGRPVLVAHVDNDDDLTPATALFHRFPLTLANHRRRTMPMDLSRGQDAGRRIMTDWTTSELETLPMSQFELEGCHR